jgi:hypothetical protein
MKYAWVYVDTSKQVGDGDHVRLFADADSVHAWFMVHDPEEVAFEYPIICEQGDAPLQPN